jgi:outer membrane lipoprotein-sorting protein
MLTRSLVALCCCVALLLPARAFAQDKLPTAREVIDRYVQATGGRDALAKYHSRRAVGRISMPAQGVEGDVEILAARPDLMRLRMTIPGVGEIQSGYDGKTAWSVNPLTGPMLMQGKSLEQTKADADFDATLHSDKQYKTLETVEKTTFEGRPAYKIRAVRTTGDEDFEYFDAENGLMLGAEVTRESPMGPVKATHVTSDYKDFGGVKIASRITQRLMGTEQIITLSEVEYDKVDTSAFTPPPAIQALVK